MSAGAVWLGGQKDKGVEIDKGRGGGLNTDFWRSLNRYVKFSWRSHDEVVLCSVV